MKQKVIFFLLTVVVIAAVGFGIWAARSQPLYFLNGTFSRDFNSQQSQALTTELQGQFNVDVLIMESFPAQFRVPSRGGIPVSECRDIQSFMDNQEYVDSVGNCRQLGTDSSSGLDTSQSSN